MPSRERSAEALSITTISAPSVAVRTDATHIFSQGPEFQLMMPTAMLTEGRFYYRTVLLTAKSASPARASIKTGQPASVPDGKHDHDIQRVYAKCEARNSK